MKEVCEEVSTTVDAELFIGMAQVRLDRFLGDV